MCAPATVVQSKVVSLTVNNNGFVDHTFDWTVCGIT